MRNESSSLSRREFVKLAGVAAAGSSLLGIGSVEAEAESPRTISLFDGKTLDGWIQVESNATSLSVGGIADQLAFTSKLASGTDAVSVFLRGKLDDALKANLPTYLLSNANAKATISALVKEINQLILGPSIYENARFGQVVLRPETEELIEQNKQNPSGLQRARLNKLLLEDAYPAELARSAVAGWAVKDGVIASTGSGRGVMYTTRDFERYRLLFKVRHLSGNPDHPACVLVFCTRPQAGEIPIDALAGIQFDVPSGGHWDYRPGMNRDGGAEYTQVANAQFDVHAWSQIELLVDATKGTARMAVAQPLGSKAVEVLDFKNAEAGKAGPIALQMHNPNLFDEYKEITVELDPKEDRLITTE